MGEASKAWDDVVASVKELGAHLKQRLDEGGDEGRKEAEAVGSSLRDLAERAKDLGSRAGAAAKDDELKGRTKAVGERLLAAFSASLKEISDDLDGVVARRKGEGAPDGEEPDRGGDPLPPPTPPGA